MAKILGAAAVLSAVLWFAPLAKATSVGLDVVSGSWGQRFVKWRQLVVYGFFDPLKHRTNQPRSASVLASRPCWIGFELIIPRPWRLTIREPYTALAA